MPAAAALYQSPQAAPANAIIFKRLEMAFSFLTRLKRIQTVPSSKVKCREGIVIVRAQKKVKVMPNLGKKTFHNFNKVKLASGFYRIRNHRKNC